MLKPSQVMVDKTMIVERDKFGAAFGSARDEVMLEVGRLISGLEPVCLSGDLAFTDCVVCTGSSAG